MLPGAFPVKMVLGLVIFNGKDKTFCLPSLYLCGQIHGGYLNCFSGHCNCTELLREREGKSHTVSVTKCCAVIVVLRLHLFYR